MKRLALFIIILLSLSGQIWAEPGPGPGAPIGGISNTFTGSFFDFNSSVRLRNHLGSELVTNGTFTGAATGWTLGTGWAYSANTVVKNADGTGTLSPTTALTITANSIYRVAYAISSMTVSSVTASLGGITMPISEDNDASVVFYIVATNTNNLAFTPTNTSRFTIDTISVKKVGTYTADSVLLFEDDINAVNGNGGLFLIGENKQINRIGGGFGLGDPQIINHQNSGLANYEYGWLGKISSSAGGLYLGGYTDADNAGAVQLYGYLGTADPTDTNPAVLITGAKKNGTGAQALGALETVLQILNSTTELVTITGSGNVFIGDPVNTKSTLGLTINQAANDDEILSFKSSDVVHVGTNLTESDTFGRFGKVAGANGGLSIIGTIDDGAAGAGLYLSGERNAAVGSVPVILLNGSELSGGNAAPIDATDILFAIRNDTNGNVFIMQGNGSVYINDSSNANSTIGLTIQQGANDNTIFALKSSDVGHTFSFVEADTYAYMQKLSATAGGLFLGSMTDGDATAMMLLGMIGNNNPTDTTPAIKLIGGKLDGAGTGLTVLGDAETVLQVLTGDSVTTTALFTILGSGYTGVRDVAPLAPLSVAGYASLSSINTTAYLDSTNVAIGTTLQFQQVDTPRWALTSESGGANFNIYQYTAGWLIALDLDSSLNMGLATSLFGTNAAKVFAIGSGTAPTTSPADAVQIWSADLNAEAGKAALHLRTEDGAVHVFGSNVGIGTTGPGLSLDVKGAAYTNQAARGTIRSMDSTAMATGVGGGIVFNGIYTGTSQVDFAGIKGVKENVTDNNYAGALSFATRLNGASLTENMILSSAGNLTLLNGTLTVSGTGNSSIAGNVGIGTTTFGTSLVGGLAMGVGTAATSQPANIGQAWVADIVAGDARWQFLGEAGNAIYFGNSVISGPGMQLVHTINKAASANVRNSHDAEATHTGDTVYTKAKTITLPNGLIGAARFLFNLKTSDAGTPTIAYGRIYRNGVALGTEQTDITGGYVTKSEDLTQTWNPGDTCELWVKIADGTDTVYVQNFRIAYDDSASITVASSNSTP